MPPAANPAVAPLDASQGTASSRVPGIDSEEYLRSRSEENRLVVRRVFAGLASLISLACVPVVLQDYDLPSKIVAPVLAIVLWSGWRVLRTDTRWVEPMGCGLATFVILGVVFGEVLNAGSILDGSECSEFWSNFVSEVENKTCDNVDSVWEAKGWADPDSAATLSGERLEEWRDGGYCRDLMNLPRKGGLAISVFYRSFCTWFIATTLLVLTMGTRFIHAVVMILPGFLLLVLMSVMMASSNVPVSETVFVAVVLTYLPGTCSVVYFAYSREQSHYTLWTKSLGQQRKIQRQNTEISRQTTAINKMSKTLKEAQKILKKVASEGGSLLERFRIDYAQLEFHTVSLGEGAFGTVRLGTFRGQDVAIKTVRLTIVSEQTMNRFLSELRIMAPLRHENIVLLHGGCWEQADELAIVLEFCSNGTLKGFLHGGNSTWEGSRHALALGSARGLAYLHHDLNQVLVHRDIKPGNILVDAHGVAKIADFGESTWFDQKLAKLKADEFGDADDVLTMTMVGTRLYCSPEVMRHDPYNESTDIFSFSLVVLGLAVGDTDYIRHMATTSANRGYNESAGFSTRLDSGNYRQGQRPPIPSELERTRPRLVELIRAMWRDDFRVRPSANVVVAELLTLGGALEEPVEPAEPTQATVAGTEELARALESGVDLEKVKAFHATSTKQFALFLCYHKGDCSSEARLVQTHYEELLDTKCFLKSSGTCDVRVPIEVVKDSNVLLLFLSEHVFEDSRCLVELSVAIDAGIPILALDCGVGDFDRVGDFVTHLDSSLARHPGTVAALDADGIDPLRLAYKLSCLMPSLSCVPLNVGGSKHAFYATMVDLANAAKSAKALSVDSEGFSDWLQKRKAIITERQGIDELFVEDATLCGTRRGHAVQNIEDELHESRAYNANLLSMLQEREAKIQELEAKAQELQDSRPERPLTSDNGTTKDD